MPKRSLPLQKNQLEIKRFIYYQFKVVIKEYKPKVTELKPNDKVALN
jgi:hypothetical protein